jgi:hypothetical protein
MYTAYCNKNSAPPAAACLPSYGWGDKLPHR